MRRTLLFAALSIVCLLAALSALAQNAGIGRGEAASAVSAQAPVPYRPGPLGTREGAGDPGWPLEGAGRGAALVTLLALGIGLRWADRAGASRRRIPAQGLTASAHAVRPSVAARSAQGAGTPMS